MGLLALAGCRPASERQLMATSFEDLDGWIAPTPSWLTTTMVHSGRYACLADAASEFGATYHTTLGQLDTPRRLRVRTWAWLPHGRLNLSVVLLIQRGQETKLWRAMSVSQAITRYQQWEPVEHDFILPHDLEADDTVKIFVWQFGFFRGDAYLDDFTLEKIN